MYQILADENVQRVLTFDIAVNLMERTFRADTENALVAPPRFSVDAEKGSLVFTAGAETKYSESIGFRVYVTFPGPSAHRQQLVVVYDSNSGGLKGIIVGALIGAMRTAAIDAVAIKYLANEDVRTLGIIGSGFQAGFHLQAALRVRRFQKVRIYSRTAQHREAFAAKMTEKTGLPIEPVPSAEDVVASSDVLICATKSASPVFETEWVKPGTHITTIGPKFKNNNELPLEVAGGSQVIATDSLQQVDSYAGQYFLSGTKERERMVDLSEIVTGKKKGRQSPQDITLFCSIGLAGTEVVLANEVLRLAH
jgi:ornithine cyclodeaminase/alanine dehydrogenase-like protein (mu-crystallin family)